MSSPESSQSASPRRQRSKRGQAIFIFVFAFAMMAGVLGLVLDGGRIYLEKRRAQAAADAGAAGAVVFATNPAAACAAEGSSRSINSSSDFASR